MTETHALCSYCARKTCYAGDLSQSPDFCPSKAQPDTMAQARGKLDDPDNQRMAQDVARTWKDYGKLTRIEETVLYARLRDYQKIGLAFCVGLAEEAELLTNIFINEGFEVASVCCMCGGLSSEDVNLPEEDKIVPQGRQPMCNPIGQAEVLGAAASELNIILGLCVGDDTLFIKHSEAPVTILAVKDRVLAHNPLAALYTSRSIYTRLKTRKPKDLKL